MIGRVLEWYRVVDVQPTPETIDRRTAAVTALVQALDDAQDFDNLLGTTAGVIAGFDKGHAADAPHVTQIVSSLRQQDSTIPGDLTENALELRTAAAIALGELMARSPDKPAGSVAIMVAMLIESGMGLRPRPEGRHLAAVLNELVGLARQVLNGSQRHRRRRSALVTVKKLPTFGDAQADSSANVKALATAVKTVLTEFSQQAVIDREELDILWWLYGSVSTTTNAALVDLAPGKAAVACGVEVADLCLLPPLANADAFVRRAMREVKRADTKRALEKIIGETDLSVWSLLNTPDANEMGENFPTLFPLSWLCGRLSASNGAAGWAAEFADKTGLDSDRATQPVEVAVQAFHERVAQRQYASRD